MNPTNAELIRIIEIARGDEAAIAIDETEHELNEAVQLTATLAICELSKRINPPTQRSEYNADQPETPEAPEFTATQIFAMLLLSAFTLGAGGAVGIYGGAVAVCVMCGVWAFLAAAIWMLEQTK